MSITLRFNTGRKYSEHGQRITAFIHDSGAVDFNDHDRGIDGRLNDHLPAMIPGDLTITAHWVMARYDRGAYRDLFREERQRVALDPEAVFAPVR